MPPFWCQYMKQIPCSNWLLKQKGPILPAQDCILLSSTGKNYILDGQDPYFFSSMWAKEWPKWAEDSQNKRNTNNSPCYIVLFPSSPKKQSFLTLNKAKPLCFTINPLWTKSIWWLDISLVFFCFLRTKVKSRSIIRE